MLPEFITHPIPPVYNEQSEILILGSFPSVKSREAMFFYGHPQNRYWRVLAAVFEQPVPQTVLEKRAFLLRNHIAAWDVIASCEIEGSSDASIKNVTPNDLVPILRTAPIRQIYVNGKTAEKNVPKIHRTYHLSPLYLSPLHQPRQRRLDPPPPHRSLENHPRLTQGHLICCYCGAIRGVPANRRFALASGTGKPYN